MFELIKKRTKNVKNEFTSGITVALDLITWNMASLKFIFPYALILTGIIESLLTFNLIDEISETLGNSNKVYEIDDSRYYVVANPNSFHESSSSFNG